MIRNRISYLNKHFPANNEWHNALFPDLPTPSIWIEYPVFQCLLTVVLQISKPNRLIFSLISQAGVYKRVRFKCVLCYLLINSSFKIPLGHPTSPPTLTRRSNQDLEDLFSNPSLAKVNYLPLNNSIFKDLTIVFCWRDFRKFRFHFKFPIPAKQGRRSNVRGLLGRWEGGNAVSVTSLIIVYISYLRVAPLSSFLSCRWFPKRKKNKEKTSIGRKLLQ